MQDDLIRRFHTALPGVRQWIDQFLDVHADRAYAVNILGLMRLSACFPGELLGNKTLAMTERYSHLTPDMKR
jgi:hypothetical protein